MAMDFSSSGVKGKDMTGIQPQDLSMTVRNLLQFMNKPQNTLGLNQIDKGKKMKKTKQFWIPVTLLILLIIFLALINKYKTRDNLAVVNETKVEQTTKPSPILSVSITPAPQDPKKPKLTTNFIRQVYIQTNKPIDDLVAGGGILSYSEHKTGSESGQIDRFKFSIFPRESIEADMALYPTTLNIFDGNKQITTKKYEYLSLIGSVQVKTKNQSTKIFKLFTFGAHCCVSLVPVTVIDNQIYVGELLDVMNTDTISRDQFFVRDDKLYKIVYDDRFSYYNMSFAGSTAAFFPMIYLVDKNGFTPVQDQFKDFYEKLYQATVREQEQIDNRFINWEDPSLAEYLYAKKIYSYAVGYLAGHDRAELKVQLATAWPNLVFNEEEVFTYISKTKN